MWDAQYVQGQGRNSRALTEWKQQAGTTGVYKKRHDKVAGIVHLSLCEKYGLTRSEQLYQHTAEPAIETERSNVSIRTDHVIEHRRPDIVVLEKDNKTALLIDIAVPGDTRPLFFRTWSFKSSLLLANRAFPAHNAPYTGFQFHVHF